MNVLFIGTGKGSWQVRSKQVGAELGARVTAKPSGNDWQWADVVVLVKHAAERWGHEAKSSRAVVLWDVLDWWQQPEENQVSIAEMVAKVKAVRDRFGFDQVIGATQAMADDLGGIYIPHHGRTGLTATPVRELKVIAYEGTPKFLGKWSLAVANACLKLGLVFVIQYAHDLSQSDLVVAFRDGKWDGELCRRWKSGVKYSNAMTAGRPVLTQASAAFEEMQPPGTVLEDPADLVPAIREWQDIGRRQDAQTVAREKAAAYTIGSLGHRYRAILQSVARAA